MTKFALGSALPPGPPPVPVAPSLLSPADGAAPGEAITFDWRDVVGAAIYTIQIDNSQTFSAPLTVNQTVPASQFTTSALPTIRM